MATTTVYASSESGYVWCNDATYLTSARGDGSLTESGINTLGIVGQFIPGDYYVYQSFIEWDTSAVGTDSVSAVVFEVDGENDWSDTDFVVESYAFDFGTLTTADLRDSDTGIPALGSIISSYDTNADGPFDTGTGYNNDLGANAAFASAINGAGDTRTVVISQEHRNESAPTTDERLRFQLTGNTNDARLTITHAPSVTYAYASPDADTTTTGWAATPLWSKVDDDVDTPDGTVITATAS